MKYNYMFRPYMWAIFRLRFNLQISYTRCVGSLGGWGTRSRCFNSWFRDPGLFQVDFSLVIYVHMSSGYYSCAKDVL